MEESIERFIPILSKNIAFNKLKDNEFILSNTNYKHYLKINEDVYNVLSLIDGRRNISKISELIRSHYNKTISGKDIYSLLMNKLVNYGVLENYDHKILPYVKPSYLKLSFIIINEKNLAKIVRYFSFLFKRHISIPIIILFVVCSIYIMIKNIELYRSFNIQTSILLFFILKIISVTLHEIGHATAASYFGAKHGGIGGGFYLIKPVYYADVTDIWRLNKSQKIIVSLAGVYFEVLFCSILSIISFISENYIIMITSLFIMISALFNLNPFLRSDGYWIISDLISKPNLSSHSSKKVREVFYFILKKNTMKWKTSDLYLLIYGIINYSILILFIYYIVIKDPHSIIYFPLNIYNFIRNIIIGIPGSLIEYSNLVIPFIFYYLFFRFLRKSWRKYNKKYLRS